MFNLTLICYRETKIIFLRLKLAFAKINYGNFAFLLWPPTFLKVLGIQNDYPELEI